MPNSKAATIEEFRIRAKLPKYLRFAAIALLALALLAVGVAFYRERTATPFKVKSEHTQLSTEVVAEVNGYERLEAENGVLKYYIKADYAKTFSDNHQELTNLYLETFDANGVSADKLTADSALYVPEEANSFTAYLKGNVAIETRDSLKVKGNNVTFSRSNETATADDGIEFVRRNVKGRAVSAVLNLNAKRLELNNNVEVETFDSDGDAASNFASARMTAATAVLDQAEGKISLGGGISINIGPKTVRDGTTDIKSGRAVADISGGSETFGQLKSIQFFDDVQIAQSSPGSKQTNISTGYAAFDKPADRFALKNSVYIRTGALAGETELRSSEAVYERALGRLAMTGSVQLKSSNEDLKGDSLFATLNSGQQLTHAVMRGNAVLTQTTSDKVSTVSSPELNASFDGNGSLSDANSIGESSVTIDPAGGSGGTEVIIRSKTGIGMVFKGVGQIDKVRSDGRTTIQLNVPNTGPAAANKRLTADVVTTSFAANGRDLSNTQASGNAELLIEPLNAGNSNYKTTITAPRFDCEFFPTGNNAKSCLAGKKAKVVRQLTLQTERRGTQTLSADQLTTRFGEGTGDIDVFEAIGNSRFSELDRTAISQRLTYTRSDEIVRLRGGEPTVWDSDFRAKAGEIDWDTKLDRSYLRRGVATTYYSRKKLKDAAPFSSSEKPVFITSETADVDHLAQTVTYFTNARAWQENNFVKGDRIFIDQTAGKFTSDGRVQSMLYTAKNRDAVVPTSATAGSMSYDRNTRLLQYRNAVDIRQGTDRVTSGSADIFLNENNELTRSIAENNVVVTQPGRKATGDWLQYVAENESAVIRGNPAVVNDAEKGTSSGGQLSFYMRENRVVTEGSSKQNTTGRTKTVYKIKPAQ